MKSMKVVFGDDDPQKYGTDHLDSSAGNAETETVNTKKYETIKDNMVPIKQILLEGSMYYVQR